jgi:putative sterol carrier protein
MSDRTAEFFQALGRRGHEPELEKTTGTLRVDLEHEGETDHWLLTISKGDVRVSREDRETDAVLRTTKALFDRFVTGEANMYSAWVRNDLTALGDVRIARLIQRLMPGPPGAHHPRTTDREPGTQA